MRHLSIDIPGQLNEPGLDSCLLRFPRKIKGIDGDAVAAETRTGIKRHESKGFSGSGFDDFPDVDVHPVAHQRDLVDQPDVNHSKSVLQQLHHFGDARRTHRNHSFERLAIKESAHFSAYLSDADDDFRNVFRLEFWIARVDAFRRKT